jgi:hypothetical protein
MGGDACEMVLDVKFRFRCQNNSGRIYKITGFTFRRQTRKSQEKSRKIMLVCKLIFKLSDFTGIKQRKSTKNKKEIPVLLPT